jgi:hypothetical protein
MTFWVAGAAVVGGIGGALIGSSAASKAAGAQTAAANQANQTSLDEYNQTRSDQAPWRAAGSNALTQLTGNLSKGFSPGDLTKDPGYQFELNQGMQGLDRSAASRGRLYSGAQMKAADTYATDFAGTKYNDAYNRWVTGNNELAGVAGIGQTATNATDQAAQNYGQQYGQNITGASNAQASGYLAQGNALSSALNSGLAGAAYGMRGYNPSSSYAYSGGGVGTGAYVDPSSGATYNNPSAYVGP